MSSTLRLAHSAICACHSRRSFLAGTAALGAAAALPGRARADSASFIDTHHHFYPPPYQQAFIDWDDSKKLPH